MSSIDADSEWKSDHFAPGIVPDDYKPQMDEEQLIQSTSDLTQEPSPLDTGRLPNALLSKIISEPSESSESPYLEDANAQPGVCGLRNLGNTCYMNAGIQALLSVARLTQYFNSASTSSEHCLLLTDNAIDSKDFDKFLNQVDSLLFHAYSRLSRSVWSGKYSYLTPTNFKAFLGEAFHPFRGYKAHDCQEFMGVFLDHMNAVLRTEKLKFSNTDELLSSEPSKKSPRLEGEDTSPSVNHLPQISEEPTVVEDAFMGLFSTKITCSECRQEIVLEEPFFFLSVPLPRGFERQFRITWCPLTPIPSGEDCLAPDSTPISVTECLVTVFKNQNVSDLKASLLQMLGLSVSPATVSLVEVSGSTPHRLLQDALIVSYIKDDFRSVYAVEMKVTPSSSLDRVATSPLSEDTDVTVSKPLIPNINGVVSSTTGEDIPSANSTPHQTAEDAPSKEKEDPPVNPASLSYHTCAICLEEIQDTDLMVHPTCGCTLCETCLSLNCSRVTDSGDTPCPVCSEATTTESFIPYPQLQTYQPETKRVPMFVIFRYKAPLDTADGDRRSHKLHPFSHPCLMEVDNHLKGYQLYSWVTELPRPSVFQLDLTFQLSLTDDLQDTRQVPPDFSDVIVRPSDRLFVDFEAVPDMVVEAAGKKMNHASVEEERLEPLTLWNCLEAFSQLEFLGPENMWFCPKCQESKSAEKFIRIKELPSTLIIHLKRFAFHGSRGDKIDAPVKFPFSDTDFSSYVFSTDSTQTDRLSPSSPAYDLISCVCHFGGLHGGHYTAYTKHPISQDWVYYNDHKADLRDPEEQTDTYKEAYILIYQQRGESAQIQASTELEEREEERRMVQLIVERIQREEAAKVVYGPAPAPVSGPTENPFIKDTYKIDFEEFSEDYYPDNPSSARVIPDGVDASAAGQSKEADPSENNDTSTAGDTQVSAADSTDRSPKINAAVTDRNLEFQWDHIM